MIALSQSLSGSALARIQRPESRVCRAARTLAHTGDFQQSGLFAR
jgi:hypothetical protein